MLTLVRRLLAALIHYGEGDPPLTSATLKDLRVRTLLMWYHLSHEADPGDVATRALPEPFELTLGADARRAIVHDLCSGAVHVGSVVKALGWQESESASPLTYEALKQLSSAGGVLSALHLSISDLFASPAASATARRTHRLVLDSKSLPKPRMNPRKRPWPRDEAHTAGSSTASPSAAPVGSTLGGDAASSDASSSPPPAGALMLPGGAQPGGKVALEATAATSASTPPPVTSERDLALLAMPPPLVPMSSVQVGVRAVNDSLELRPSLRAPAGSDWRGPLAVAESSPIYDFARGVVQKAQWLASDAQLRLRTLRPPPPPPAAGEGGAEGTAASASEAAAAAKTEHDRLQAAFEATTEDGEWLPDGEALEVLCGTSDLDAIASRVCALAGEVRRIAAAQPSLAHVTPPCKIFGDLHGQLRDGLEAFQAFGFPSHLRSGDIESGARSTTVLALSLACVCPPMPWMPPCSDAPHLPPPPSYLPP